MRGIGPPIPGPMFFKENLKKRAKMGRIERKCGPLILKKYGKRE